jgi:hypothetical protein
MTTQYLVINPSMIGHPAEHGEPAWDEPDVLSDNDFRAWGYPHAGWFALDNPHLIVAELDRCHNAEHGASCPADGPLCWPVAGAELAAQL